MIGRLTGSHIPMVGLGARADHLDRLEHEVFDVAIVGGGITGAGIALDAATRGLRVALVEKHDFASGTSSRSTKLIHGGLRYLAQLEFALTREALIERRLLRRLAPVLVEPVPFIFPIYSGTFDALRIDAGLWLYDFLAGIRGTQIHRRLSRAEVLRRVPGLADKGLTRAFLYYDCQTDDVRLTIEVLRTAAQAGAALANHLRVVGFDRANGRVAGLECRDVRTGREILVRARTVVVACGVWLNQVVPASPGSPTESSLAAESTAVPRVRPSKGVHLVVSRERFGIDTAFALPTGRDGRLVFAVPWLGHTLIGTTDTPYDGDYDAPAATKHDVEYLLEVINYRFPDAHLRVDDVLSAMAGLRPLVDDGKAATTSISREDRVFEEASGIIGIAGGKLTTYRRMARKVVDLVVRRLAEAHAIDGDPRSVTSTVPLGAFGRLGYGDLDGGLAPNDVVDCATHEYLVQRYGAQAAAIVAIAADDPRLRDRLLPDQPTIAAEVVHAARSDMAQTVADVLVRRTHLALFDPDQARRAAPIVAKLLAEELGWTAEEAAAAVVDYEREAAQYSVRDLA